MFRLLYICITGIAFFLLLSCGSKNKPDTKVGNTGVNVVDAVVVQSAFLQRLIEAPGTILAGEAAELHPEIAGRVTGIFFKEGSFVKKGTLLMKLFDADLRAQWEKLVVQLKIARAAEARQKQLLAVSGTSQQEYESASLQTANIQADMQLVRVNLSKTEIRAPFDGRVGLRLISPGAYVTPTTVVTNIAATAPMKIQFSVSEQYVRDVTDGTHVTFSIAGSSKKYVASVIASENQISADTRSLMIKAVVNNMDEMVKPGAFANVLVNIGNNRPAMMLPTQSVIPQTRGKRVIVVRKGMTIFQNVETGYRDSAAVEILSGLVNGDTVLTSGLLLVKPGQKINKLNIKR